MNSRHLEDELSSYVSGELDADETRRVEEHLRECAACSEKVTAFRQLNEVLNEANALDPSPFFTKRVMASVEEEKKIVAFRSRRTIAWLSIAASIVFAVFLISVRKETVPVPPPISHWHPNAHTQPETVAPTVKEKEPAQQPISKEDADLIANLDVLENMDVIQNYDNLEYLEAAVIANVEEKTE